MPKQELDYDKLANTVLYLLEGSVRPGSTHLLKMLWYADYWHYKKHLRSITGGQYVAMKRGPVLDGYKNLFQKLATDGVVGIDTVPVWQHPENDKIELQPLMEANDGAFSDAERETLDLVLREFGDKNGNWMSERSHREPPWMITYPVTPNAAIPYSIFRWIENAPTDADLVKAKEVLSRPECREAIDSIDALLADVA